MRRASPRRCSTPVSSSVVPSVSPSSARSSPTHQPTRASEIGRLAATTAGQTDIFVAGQQHAFDAAIVVTALALIASLALIRVQKAARPTPSAEPALVE